MNHEPECPYQNGEDPVFRMFINEVEIRGCTFCEVIRSAYQRGREDAAEAVEVAIARGHSSIIDEIVGALEAAARGDGEQQ